MVPAVAVHAAAVVVVAVAAAVAVAVVPVVVVALVLVQREELALVAVPGDGIGELIVGNYCEMSLIALSTYSHLGMKSYLGVHLNLMEVVPVYLVSHSVDVNVMMYLLKNRPFLLRFSDES